MSKALKDLTDEALDGYCADIARAAEAAIVVDGPLPAVVEHAAAEAAAEVTRRWEMK